MKPAVLAKWIPAAVALLGGCLVLFLLFLKGPGIDIKERVPGTDRREGDTASGTNSTPWEGKLIASNGIPATNLMGAWPQFRGPNLDGISPDPTALAKSWPATGPKVLWKIDVGEGFAGAAISKGRVYLMDYDQKGQADALRCLSLTDGQEIWRYTYPAKVKRNHGMSRTVPTVAGPYVVAMSPKCQVICVDSLSGELKWQMNLVREFNTEVPPWYAGQCPLVDSNRVILATGGDALLVAVDLATGKVIWKSANPGNWQMTHTSVAPMEFKGRRMYVYGGSGGVAGVAADDGSILWENPDWKINIAAVPSPVPVGDGKVFLSGGYEAGSLMLQLKEAGGKLTTEALFRLKPAVFGATQHTPVFNQNHLFGIRPDGQLVCLDLNGKPLWQSGPKNRFGNGPFLVAQGLIFVMNDNGLLSLAELSTSAYKQLGQIQVLAGPDSWGPMALADGRLILRDLFKLVCLDVSGK